MLTALCIDTCTRARTYAHACSISTRSPLPPATLHCLRRLLAMAAHRFFYFCLATTACRLMPNIPHKTVDAVAGGVPSQGQETEVGRSLCLQASSERGCTRSCLAVECVRSRAHVRCRSRSGRIVWRGKHTPIDRPCSSSLFWIAATSRHCHQAPLCCAKRYCTDRISITGRT